MAFIVAELLVDTMPRTSWFVVLALFTFIQVVMNVLLVTAVKWLVVGRFKEGKYALYSVHVWKTELIERLEEGLVLGGLLMFTSGTYILPWYYRMQGAKIGKRCYIDDACVCEPDLINLGDYVTIEQHVTLQAHLFTDRMRTVGESCDTCHRYP